jgi:hypothetical protein
MDPGSKADLTSKSGHSSQNVDARSGGAKVLALRRTIDAKNELLLGHRYFRLCETHQISRPQAIEMLKQAYCFLVFLERLLTRRIAGYSSATDERIIGIARKHLRDEIGHAELLRDCLKANAVTPSELFGLAPKMFTKAMFGYLTATILHENEYVSNVAIMQVMESIGYHVLAATREIMRHHRLSTQPAEQHAVSLQNRAHLGIELAADFDELTMLASRRVIDDLYRLMGFVLDEWLGPSDEPPASFPKSKSRSGRPRSN